MRGRSPHRGGVVTYLAARGVAMSTLASLRTAGSEYVMTVRPACNYHTRARDVAGCVQTRALTGGAVIVGMAVSGAASPRGRLVPAAQIYPRPQAASRRSTGSASSRVLEALGPRVARQEIGCSEGTGTRVTVERRLAGEHALSEPLTTDPVRLGVAREYAP
jgi:hypothetical protein